MSRIVLASGSFLKNFIMEKSTLEYEVIAADIDESIFDDLPVAERVEKLAVEKCKVVAEKAPDAIVIAADTLTSDSQGVVYTKLTASEDPFEHAMRLSGQTIQVHTGCCVALPGGEPKSTVAQSTIEYQTFDENLLRRLIKGDDASIRSGALGIFFDSPGFTLIKNIHGTYTGSFGLPMEFIYGEIKSYI